ncbi:phage tail assembly protein [Phormidium sp. LEGE 05292]|uniref:phage tail assembly protein n=1 Tax=[Phormidium] sp. LEGE 05292 TaxID=767427 RepID=UPI0018808C2C|nr:phage tail assembly protein [Phormidium sp. LEGE 05292]MBE9225456.1 phage tail assembly protein [Phormidium sp. LEGE 05292]
MNSQIHTQFKFSLPKGLLDNEGNIHRQGVMRLATAKDEIIVQKDPLVRENPAYGVLVMLSRTITQLGELSIITPELLEELFTLDLAYLREFYNQINHQESASILVQCPKCNSEFNMELTLSGESKATP